MASKLWSVVDLFSTLLRRKEKKIYNILWCMCTPQFTMGKYIFIVFYSLSLPPFWGFFLCVAGRSCLHVTFFHPLFLLSSLNPTPCRWIYWSEVQPLNQITLWSTLWCLSMRGNDFVCHYTSFHRTYKVICQGGLAMEWIALFLPFFLLLCAKEE